MEPWTVFTSLEEFTRPGIFFFLDWNRRNHYQIARVATPISFPVAARNALRGIPDIDLKPPIVSPCRIHGSFGPPGQAGADSVGQLPAAATVWRELFQFDPL